MTTRTTYLLNLLFFSLDTLPPEREIISTSVESSSSEPEKGQIKLVDYKLFKFYTTYKTGMCPQKKGKAN